MADPDDRTETPPSETPPSETPLSETPPTDTYPSAAPPADAAPGAEPVVAPESGQDSVSGPAPGSDPATDVDLAAFEQELDAVEAALARLADGTYRTDEITGEPIPDHVLADDPTARRA